MSKMSTIHLDAKEKQLDLLKGHVEIIQKELNNAKESYLTEIVNIKKSCDEQINLIKDREMFTVEQLREVEDRYSNLKSEKEAIVNLLKEEIDELKNQNRLMNLMTTKSNKAEADVK